MNTPGHVVVSALILRIDQHPQRTVPAVLGAVLPDAPMFLFYVYERFIAGKTEGQIWGSDYFAPAWQALFDSFNSIPIVVLLLIISLWRGWSWSTVLLLSMLLHFAGDLPLHHDDGHRHFFPLSDWRFSSPISYWDPRYHGHVIALIELAFTVVGSIYLVWSGPNWTVRGTGVTILAVLAVFLAFVLLTWL